MRADGHPGRHAVAAGNPDYADNPPIPRPIPIPRAGRPIPRGLAGARWQLVEAIRRHENYLP